MKKANLTSATINELDKSRMLDLLMDFPSQLVAAVDIVKNAKVLFEKRDFTNIVFAGLGGSAIGADLVKAYLYYESRLPINVFRDYDLPAYVDNKTLVFISSYSGNTEETLSAYLQAKEKGATLIAVSSDGTVEKYAKNDGVTFIGVPRGFPPRCALGYLSAIPLCLLAKLGLIKDVGPAISQTVRILQDLRDKGIGPGVGLKDNVSKFIASKLVNKFAVVYTGSVHFDVCATRLRGQINENAKALASTHVFPEMNHNEIVGWQHPKKLFKDFLVLMLKDKKMHPRVAKRMEITKEILKKEGVAIIEVWPQGEELLSRMYSLIYKGDFISYYLAILYGIDPTPVEKITYLKNELAKIS